MTPTTTSKAIKEETPKKSKLQESAEKLEKERKGRQESDIGLGDKYWDLLKEHRKLYNESKE